MRKAVFLDRDGIINHDPGDYTKSVTEFQILPGVLEALQQLNQVGFELVVITNQGGIAKGLYSLSDFYAIDANMHNIFSEHNIRVLRTYFCPHHPDYGRCLCRKPQSLMVEKALHQFDLDAASSVMVGDKERDVQCAEGAGVKGVQVPTNANLKNYLHLLTKSDVN